MNFMIVPDMLVCSSFLISVGMFIVSKAQVHSVRRFVPMLRGLVLYVCCCVKKKALLKCLCNY